MLEAGTFNPDWLGLAEWFSRKVGQVVFHPTASSLLASASGDHLVRLWDIEKGQEEAAITLKGHNDTIQSLCWNAVGTTLVTVNNIFLINLPLTMLSDV